MANSVGVDGYIHIERFEKFEREAFDKEEDPRRHAQGWQAGTAESPDERWSGPWTGRLPGQSKWGAAGLHQRQAFPLGFSSEGTRRT